MCRWMAAGSGVRHSETIWRTSPLACSNLDRADESGGKPSWGATQFPKSDRPAAFVTLARGFDEGALHIRATHG